MANEFKIKKGLIVTGASGGTVVDIQGSQGQLFSVTDNLSGSIFAVSDISGVPIFDVNSSGLSTFDGLVSGITPVNAANFVTKAYVDGSGGGTGPFLPLAGGTMTGVAGVVFPDAFKLNLGTGSDLEIYHNGTTGNNNIDNISGDLYISQYANDKDIIFRSDDGSGGVAEYFRLDGSVAGSPYVYTKFPDYSVASFGNGNDLQIYHNSNDSYIVDTGTGDLRLVASATKIYDADLSHLQASFTDGGSVDLYYSGNKKFETTTTGVTVTGAATATTFLGDLNGTINTATTGVTQVNSVDNTTIATTAYVNNKIGLIPAGLVFQGTWNAATNTPTLASGTGTTGNFYIVSVAGSTNLDGITDWKVGDWAVFIEQGLNDQWEKIDNSSVLDGIGTGGSVAGWAGSGTSNTLTNAPITFSSNDVTFSGNVGVGTSPSSFYPGTHNLVVGDGGGEHAVTVYSGATSTGYLLFADGSSGSSRYAGQVRYDHNTDSMEFSVNNSSTAKLTINSLGNATFAGDVTTGPNITATGNTGNSTLTLQANTGNWIFTNVQASRDLQISDSDGTGTVMTINTSGNVGVGNISPGAKLVVGANVNSNATGIEVNAGASGGNVLSNGTADNWFPYVDNNNYYSASDHIFRSEVNANTRMTIKSSGNVGIGTTSPTDYGASANTLEVRGASGTGAGLVRVSNAGNTVGAAFYSGSASSTLGTQTNHELNIATNNTSRVVIGNTGAVKFSAYAAGTLVTDASGNISVSSGGGAGGPYLPLAGGNMDSGAAITFVVPSVGGNFININHTGNENWSFGAQSGTGADDYIDIGINGGTRAMSWHEDGKVGIGTTSPDEKLDITGGYLKFNGGDYGIKGSASLTYNPVSDHYFMSSGSTKVTIKASGFVGIGTTTFNNYWSGYAVLKLGADNGFFSNITSSTGSALFIAQNVYNDGNVYRYVATNESGLVDMRDGKFSFLTAPSGSAGATATMTNRFTILQGGNVGIGTTSPGAKLHVDNSAASLALHVSRNGGGAVTNAATIVSGAAVYINGNESGGSDALRIGSMDNSTGDYYIDVSNYAGNASYDLILQPFLGNVGIGVTSPAVKLHVVDTTTLVGAFVSNNTTRTELAIDNTSTNNVRLGLKATPSGAIIDSTNHYGSNTQPLIFQLGALEKMRITNGGNVGIGTTVPQTKLAIGSAQGSGIDFLYDATNNYKHQIKNYWNSNTDSRMDFNIGRTSGVTPVTIMSVGYGGNVGIGTTTPLAKLDIQGTQGQLFSVTDDLSGSIFAVSDISGVPIFDVNSSGKVGINTTSANDIFDVRSSSWATRIQSTTDGTYLRMSPNQIATFNSAGAGSPLYLNHSSSGNIIMAGGGGNVGIGVTNPPQKLAVIGNISLGNYNGSDFSRSIGINDSSGTYGNGSSYIKFNELSGSGTSGTTKGAAIEFYNHLYAGNTNQTMIIQANGNVGIGDTGPVNKLNVNGDIGYTGVIGQGSIYGNTGNSSYANMQLYDPATGYSTFNNQSYGYYLQTGGSTKLTILNNGNVGIGTTSPDSLLTVSGSSLQNSNNAGIELSNSHNAQTVLLIENTTSRKYEVAVGGSANSIGNGSFYIYDGTAGDARLVIDSSGNVGIGTTSPGSKLQVAGEIRAADGNKGTPSYTFTSDTNTGMYSDTADVIDFTAGGTKSLSVTTSGATVYGSALMPSNAAILLQNQNNNNQFYIRNSGVSDATFQVGQGAPGSNVRFFINGSGNVGIGNTASTASVKLEVTGNTLLKNSNGVGDLYLGNYATANHFRFHTNNANTYFDMNCGDIYWRQGTSTRYQFFPSTANMTVQGTITQNSDARIKENVVEISNCISKVQAMRGVYYNRTDFNTDVTKVGVIAQEVEAVLPELVLESPETGLKSVAYSELTSVLINAIKEQQEIIEDLKTRITKLEN